MAIIPFWNRKDVFSTIKLDQLASVRALLASNYIAYGYKSTADLQGMGRANHSTFIGRTGEGQDPNAAIYTIYVHKRDYDQAMHIIHQNV